MTENQVVLICFIFMLLPGIYLAAKKYFLVIPNKKYNIFPIRLLFTIPAGIAISFLISIIPICVFGIFLRYILPFEYYSWGLIILSSIFTVIAFKKYFVRKDIPPEYDSGFEKHELYVYMPIQKIPRRKYTQFSFPPGVKWDKDLLTGTQKEDLKLNFKSLSKDFVFTDCGEIIVNEKAFSKFSENGFDNLFEKRPIKAVKGFRHQPYDLKEPYFQLLPIRILPPFDTKTEIKKGVGNFSLRAYAVDDKYYYKREGMTEIADFNITSEILGAYDGTPYYPQHLWIVTNKAMKVLINELNQKKRDFIPVNLVDDE
jgi:hypothetical protein